ncbi:Glycosyltransferase, GT2 family [Aureimonas altamirensis DSM 21988]|uniref:Sugar transferase n=2 Tax=Aureimonas altamirensis TaxID=370622 RepID=A0A0N7KX56_9HYPH|nr:galactosyltransferase-related protein [Aureimonas altamirensis]BAT25985.1 sugar transferase [Aureimonas altamirensis]SHI77888.1 Glycosyltransferase, GT2 family [Aureimonas altamirensis DSM 21988]
MEASVLTLVRGRHASLGNLLQGIAAQSVRPKELIIAYMQPEPFAGLPDPGCPVRNLVVPGEPMPLALARNAAAKAAQSELLIFLDVDCIASPGLVASYLAAAEQNAEGVFLGEVLYLPQGAVDGGIDYAKLDLFGRRHPAKPAMPDKGVRREPDHGELWGLSFAIRRASWDRIGGMDESFVGYGGEETDFALRLAQAGIPLFWTADARAYHQHHAVHIPPLQQFDHILRNAELFHTRHGRWCMDYWLGQFRDAGYIDWRPDDGLIDIRRRPTPSEIDAARQPGSVLYS